MIADICRREVGKCLLRFTVDEFLKLLSRGFGGFTPAMRTTVFKQFRGLEAD